jgi:hypothetical protein
MKLKMSVRKKSHSLPYRHYPKMHPNATDFFFFRNKPTLHIQVVQMSLDHRWPWRRICPVMSRQFRNEAPLSFFCRCFICIEKKKQHDKIWMEILQKSSCATKNIFIVSTFFYVGRKAEYRYLNCHWRHKTFLFKERVVSLPQKRHVLLLHYVQSTVLPDFVKRLETKKKY